MLKPPAQQGEPHHEEDSGNGEQLHVEHTAEETEHGEPRGDEEGEVFQQAVATEQADHRNPDAAEHMIAQTDGGGRRVGYIAEFSGFANFPTCYV